MATVLLLEVDHLAPALADRAPTPGLLTVAGRPQVRLVARAFAACGDVERIVLVGPAAYREAPLPEIDELLVAERIDADALETLIERFGHAEELLLCPANAPLVTPERVEDFLGRCPRDAAVACLLVRRADVSAQLGELTSLVAHRFGPEELVFAPLLLLQTATLVRHRDLLATVLAGGPNLTELVRRLGVGFAIKLRSGRATLPELAARLSELLGAPCLFQIAPCPELCLRVAGRPELRVARTLLEVPA